MKRKGEGGVVARKEAFLGVEELTQYTDSAHTYSHERVVSGVYRITEWGGRPTAIIYFCLCFFGEG